MLRRIIWDTAGILDSPYEVLAHPLIGFTEIACFKRYAELLERLYNSGYLRSTLAGLVDECFDGSVSHCFDALLASVRMPASSLTM